MVSHSIKTLVLSLSVASLATFSLAAPATGTNGCSSLAAKQGTNITYSDVANCYASIPFNKEAARATLDSLTTLFDDYHVSRDIALSPRLAKPLQGDPVDIVAKLKKIGRTRYTSDRKFHTDVYEAIESLHDGHAVYARKFGYFFLFFALIYVRMLNDRNIAGSSNNCLHVYFML
jgi:hypothetical protein